MGAATHSLLNTTKMGLGEWGLLSFFPAAAGVLWGRGAVISVFNQTIGGKHACQGHRSKNNLLWGIEVIGVECRTAVRPFIGAG